MEINELGARIRAARMERKLSQGDIEKSTGLLRCYQSRVECGRTMPSIRNLQRICAALGMELAEIFGGTEISANPPQLAMDDIEFLTKIQHYSVLLTHGERARLLGVLRRITNRRK
jgi:transcriptional regulator with XRE-family HTH domain